MSLVAHTAQTNRMDFANIGPGAAGPKVSFPGSIPLRATRDGRSREFSLWHGTCRTPGFDAECARCADAG